VVVVAVALGVSGTGSDGIVKGYNKQERNTAMEADGLER
jgi:hypothetical protein